MFDFRLPDDVPAKADVIYVPGFALTYDQTRLTALNRAVTEEAARLMQSGRAQYVVISGCYGPSESSLELRLRTNILRLYGIGPEKVRGLNGIVSTHDEFRKLGRVLDELRAKSLLIVSDEWHIPRAVRWAEVLLHGVEIHNKSVRAPRYEFTWETTTLTGRIKSLRSGIKPLWILWNFLLYPRNAPDTEK